MIDGLKSDSDDGYVSWDLIPSVLIPVVEVCFIVSGHHRDGHYHNLTQSPMRSKLVAGSSDPILCCFATMTQVITDALVIDGDVYWDPLQI